MYLGNICRRCKGPAHSCTLWSRLGTGKDFFVYISSARAYPMPLPKLLRRAARFPSRMGSCENVASSAWRGRLFVELV